MFPLPLIPIQLQPDKNRLKNAQVMILLIEITALSDDRMRRGRALDSKNSEFSTDDSLYSLCGFIQLPLGIGVAQVRLRMTIDPASPL
jgi:hypothetical protein